jgi:hypothetical protein
MILLNSTSSKLQLITSQAGSIAVQVSAIDISAGVQSFPTLANIAAIVTATTTDIVASPSASTTRNVKDISIRNTHATISNIVTIQHTDGVTPLQKFSALLLAGDTCIYDQAGDYSIYDTNGALKSVFYGSGQLLRRTILTTGTAGTFSSLTKTWIAKLKGGGGGGGGANTGAAAAACGGGGCEGGYGETALITTVPGAAFTYVIGAGGAGGVATGGTGTSGNSTSITANAITYNVNGGSGGVGMATAQAVPITALGGSPNGGVGANMAMQLLGACGEAGIIFSATVGMGGRGGGFGGVNARNTAGIGNTPSSGNQGGGGGGALVINGSVAVAGGIGSAGYIILEEYS